MGIWEQPRACVSRGRWGVRRDLFSEDDEGLYFTDAALLDQLARQRLAAMADQVRAEGWSRVDVAPRARREPSKAQAKHLAKLEAEQNRLQEQSDSEDAELSEEEIDRLGNEMDTINQSLVTYARRT